MISEFHRFRNLPQPEHPLMSVIDYTDIKHTSENNSLRWILNFYSISLKRTSNVKFKYGHQECDFNGRLMFFYITSISFSVFAGENQLPVNSGWIDRIHPEFF